MVWGEAWLWNEEERVVWDLEKNAICISSYSLFDRLTYLEKYKLVSLFQLLPSCLKASNRVGLCVLNVRDYLPTKEVSRTIDEFIGVNGSWPVASSGRILHVNSRGPMTGTPPMLTMAASMAGSSTILTCHLLLPPVPLLPVPLLWLLKKEKAYTYIH